MNHNFFLIWLLLAFSLKTISFADNIPANVRIISSGGTNLYHYSTSSDFVSVRIVILGGVNNYLKKYEGIESLALDAMLVGGSKYYTQDSIRTIFEENHVQIATMAGLDFSVIDFSCPQVLLENAWPVFIKLVCYPGFEEESFKLTQVRYHKALSEAEKLPAEQLKRASFERYLKGYPYERNPLGSLKSLSIISREMVVSYYQTLMTSSRLRILTSGNLTDSTLTYLAKSFQDLPLGKFVNRPILNKTFSKSQTSGKQSVSSTCTIRGLLSAPSGSSADVLAVELLVALLQDKITANLNGQATEISIGYLPGLQGIIVLEAETYNPYGLALLIQQQIQHVRSRMLPEELVTAKKKLLYRKTIEAFETGSGQIYWLTQGVVYNQWMEVNQLEEKLQLITPEQLQKLAKFWLIHWQWILSGNFSESIQQVFGKIP
ncbi:MAG: hypothetical protein LC115_04185 [Bacteroidia bacterium]|nr:hypothetical protein [Bacteroidia bacterium]